MTSLDQIGSGWAFPLAVGSGGGIALASGLRRIEQSIRLILMTYPGDRPMRPEFGSTLRDFVFDPLDDVTIERVKHEVRRAIEAWEPRVGAVEVAAERDPARDGVLLLDIAYRLVDTGNWDALLVPFHVLPADEEADR